MAEYIKCTPEQLPRLVRKKVAAFAARVERAVDSMPEAGARIVRRRAPKAFGVLQSSVHAIDGATVVSAPHAAAVERGSMPHKPDFEALLAWVKLRGFQGLYADGRARTVFRSSQGPTTREHAMSVAQMIKAADGRMNLNRKQLLAGSGPEQVARAISDAIEKNGTKPTWFVRNSLDEIGALLKTRLQRAKGRYSSGQQVHKRVVVLDLD